MAPSAASTRKYPFRLQDGRHLGQRARRSLGRGLTGDELLHDRPGQAGRLNGDRRIQCVRERREIQLREHDRTALPRRARRNQPRSARRRKMHGRCIGADAEILAHTLTRR